jgi:hypothetical protein
MTRKVSNKFDRPFGVTINPNGEMSLSPEARVSLDYLKNAYTYFRRLKNNLDQDDTSNSHQDTNVILSYRSRAKKSREKSFTINEMILATRGVSEIQEKPSSLVLGLFSCERRGLVTRTKNNGESLYSLTKKGKEYSWGHSNPPSYYFEISAMSFADKYKNGRVPKSRAER